MTGRSDVLTLVATTNPLPDLDAIDPIELERAMAGLEAAWQAERSGVRLGARTPGRRLRPAVVMIAVAFVLTLAIGIPLALIQGEEAPVVTQVPTTFEAPTTVVATTIPVTTAAPPPTTQTTVPPPPMPGLTIEPAATTASTEDVFLGRIIPGLPGGPAWIALGTRQPVIVEGGGFDVPLSGSVWVSDDGSEWRPVGDPAQLDGCYIEDAVAGANGYVAVGWGVDYDAAVWHSRDGIEWTRITDESFGGSNSQSMAAVAYGPAGYVAGGTASSTAAMWFSEDGVSWRRVGEDVFDTGTVPSNIWGGGGVTYGAGIYIAHGTVGFSDTYSATERHVLWTSLDGVGWEELPLESFGLTQDDDYSFGALHGGGPELLVSVGTDESETVWRTRDARTWEPWPRTFATGSFSDSSSDRPDHVATIWDGTRWVYVGFDWASGDIWITHDLGIPWQRVANLPLAQSGNLQIAATPDALVFVQNPGIPGDAPTHARFWLATWDE